MLIFTTVALRKESVDRNMRMTLIFLFSPVALRKESVDRNHYQGQAVFAGCLRVALRKESVDRNVWL